MWVKGTNYHHYANGHAKDTESLEYESKSAGTMITNVNDDIFSNWHRNLPGSLMVSIWIVSAKVAFSHITQASWVVPGSPFHPHVPTCTVHISQASWGYPVHPPILTCLPAQFTSLRLPEWCPAHPPILTPTCTLQATHTDECNVFTSFLKTGNTVWLKLRRLTQQETV